MRSLISSRSHYTDFPFDWWSDIAVARQSECKINLKKEGRRVSIGIGLAKLERALCGVKFNRRIGLDIQEGHEILSLSVVDQCMNQIASNGIPRVEGRFEQVKAGGGVIIEVTLSG